jgi:hypothetical protein
MTNCFPPLIKPDGRFSRIRLSNWWCYLEEDWLIGGHPLQVQRAVNQEYDSCIRSLIVNVPTVTTSGQSSVTCAERCPLA